MPHQSGIKRAAVFISRVILLSRAPNADILAIACHNANKARQLTSRRSGKPLATTTGCEVYELAHLYVMNWPLSRLGLAPYVDLCLPDIVCIHCTDVLQSKQVCSRPSWRGAADHEGLPCDI